MPNISKQTIKNLSYTAIISSPIGILGVKADEKFVYSIDFLPVHQTLHSASTSLGKKVVEQLNAYFNWDFDKKNFAFDLPLAFGQGSEFQQKVWKKLLAIPAGRIRHYGAIAKDIHSHARAIGSACRSNLFPIIVPCHRVLDQKNQLRGYKGSNSSQELQVKAWLLQHEKFSLTNT